MEITIEITQFCENHCDYCSTNASPEGEHLPFEKIKKFFVDLNDKLIDDELLRINISGGEPLAHPEFYKILRFCESCCKDVRVYTNALKNIIYNTAVIKEIIVEANVCLVPGRYVYLPHRAYKTHLLQLVPQGKAKDMDAGNYHVSSNITGCGCDKCDHVLLQADGKIVKAPCKKDYKEN
jgi:organic radical activating enzyme